MIQSRCISTGQIVENINQEGFSLDIISIVYNIELTREQDPFAIKNLGKAYMLPSGTASQRTPVSLFISLCIRRSYEDVIAYSSIEFIPAM